ncbi:MAG: signal peptidase I [Parachlamydiales bacterium]|nr:signal peptidase I [Verrucomicrobiota bacterium]MBX3719416.1 signal peptidase I [Candidatus Acheromyda pituitae]
MFSFSKSSTYSLKKSKTVLRHVYHVFQRKKKKLSKETQQQIKKTLADLQDAILKKDRETAAELAKQAESLSQLLLKKSTFEHALDLIFALAFALAVAILIRQMWFEFYEIPSGSMRPTLKEQDRLAVSKTTFGVNIPLQPKQFYFNPHLVKQSGIVIFTGEDMDIRDVDTLYFYLFPGKKQYVKRLIGRPGDILYFYGGKIYGLDFFGKDITPELQLASLDKIEHIPFIDFDRKLIIPSSPTNGYYSPVIVYQMNEPVAKLYVTPQGQPGGEMLNPAEIHVPDTPPIQNYSDMWGFGNYGMTRLLTREQVRYLTDQDPSSMEEGVLYLEIRHHPSVSSVKIVRDEIGRMRPIMGISTSIIPLQENHLKAIFDNMYTARFVVKNGFAHRYGYSSSDTPGSNIFLPHLHNVPNGCFEFYYGKAYSVKWQGITSELPATSPLYDFDPARVQLLYNIGMEFDMRFSPQIKNQRLVPARYTYYRDGDLYLLGAPILKKDDPALIDFLKREEARKAMSNPNYSYTPFADAGPPLNPDGSLDANLVRKFGIRIPPNMYLVLGDNHAMSSDSREFGFVPEQNLRGAPDLIFWPPGHRWGYPNQPRYPFFNGPRTVVWGIAGVFIVLGTWYWRRRNHLPLKDLNQDPS